MAKQHQNDDGIIFFLVGLFAGAVGGAILGLLFAPKTGRELRGDLQAYATHLPDKINDELKNPQGKTREFFDRTRYSIENQVERIKSDRQAGKLAKAKKAEEFASGQEAF